MSTDPRPEPVHEVADDHAVDFLVRYPDLLESLLTEHVKDGIGGCSACPPPRTGRRRWPCNVLLLAIRAVRILEAQTSGGSPSPW
ncbi:hypothetical protein AFB00_00240 [Pseudonocardia sp. HH130630-07]|nr:hypothetical protein AFB00_00240 [Pseudonocardia sp. HH130630-07]